MAEASVNVRQMLLKSKGVLLPTLGFHPFHNQCGFVSNVKIIKSKTVRIKPVIRTSVLTEDHKMANLARTVMNNKKEKNSIEGLKQFFQLLCVCDAVILNRSNTDSTVLRNFQQLAVLSSG